MDVLRSIKKELDFYGAKYPVLVVTGPRQSGKTTFLKTEFSNYQYVNMESLDNREYALKDPNGFLKQYDRYVIFDEAQRVPELFSHIQAKVDNDKIMGQYILSGSQNFQLLKNITQSLAGRVALFKLFPFDFSEMSSANLLKDRWVDTLQRGSYPALFDRDIPSRNFYHNYIQTYVERDLTDLIHIRELSSFRKFLSLCAGRAGQILNLNSLALDCGISQPTAKAWLSVLETSYIVFLLQPLHGNFNKRITKSPKLYFYDTGLLCHLLRINQPEVILTHHSKGALFENFMIAEFVKQNEHRNLMREMWFWRDAVGHEIDLVWQDDDTLNLVEFKASSTILNDMFKGLSYFDKWTDRPIRSQTVCYAGNETQKRKDITVMSWKDFDKI